MNMYVMMCFPYLQWSRLLLYYSTIQRTHATTSWYYNYTFATYCIKLYV